MAICSKGSRKWVHGAVSAGERPFDSSRAFEQNQCRRHSPPSDFQRGQTILGA
jgi:hypothetical protein